jgi:hypothetical protein
MTARTSPEPRVFTREEWQARERLQRLAWLLDSSIQVPGTRFTVGIDALIGLVPVLGDLVGVLLSSYIVAEAGRLGVSKSILARMTFNVVVEGLAGMVPLAGDLFDAAWKANQRNVQLLNDYLDSPREAKRSSQKLLVLVFGGLLLLASGIAVLGVLAWSSLF